MKLIDFKPKVRHQDALLFYIAFGIFFLMGLASLIFNDASFHPFSWIIMGFSGFILFVMWQQNAAFDVRYQLQEEGIFLKRFFWKKQFLIMRFKKLKLQIKRMQRR